MSKRGKGPWMCNRCFKRFPDPKPARDHIRNAHKTGGEPVRVPKRECEESMADRAVDAAIDRAMGVYNPDQEWLLP